MSLSTDIIAAATPTPTPFPDYTGDPNLITPGVVGFIAIFVIAIVTVLLLVDMTRRIRRSRYREEVKEQIAREQADGESTPDDEVAGNPEPGERP